MARNACLELALEGERLCKNGDFSGGVAFFEAAIRVGTDDLKTLSAIYSQLGNAYFYLGDYNKAMEYHRCDLTVARAMNDELGEGKASGNLGNTLKVMGKFDEAVTCCERHLSISRKLQDKVGEGRALYNLGNVYHAKGKRFACLGHQDPGEFPEEVKECLQKAVEHYDQSLKIMMELGDRSAQGRACGNLGNTHYLLGNFNEAIFYHKERLKIAKEFKDLAAERRAHNNLGNAHIFLGEFETAADHYKKTLSLAIELRDKAVEAQAYYSLGNTYTLLHDYPTAIEYHLRHLKIAQELKDTIGEGRAYWSLGNAHSAIGNHEQALHFANRHLEISKEIGDHSGEMTAQHCISDLQKVLETHEIVSLKSNSSNSSGRMRRISMEHMDLLKLTPDAKVAKSSTVEKENKKLSPVTEKNQTQVLGSPENSIENAAVKENPASVRKDSQIKDLESSMDEESFFDLLSRFQSKRMDDQRCSLVLSENKENNQLLGNCQNNFQPSTSQNNKAANVVDKDNNRVQDDLFDLIAGMQSRRLDEQRASLPRLPGLNYFSLNNGAIRNNNNNTIPPEQGLHRPSVDASSMPDDEFFEMLMRCQASRIEDQRSSMPDISTRQHQMYSMAHCNGNNPHAAPTVPDEDFFSLIMRLQSGRIEDQRSTLPAMPPKEKVDPLPSSSSHSSKATGTSSKTGSLRSSLKSAKGSLKR
ncbi:G-protein-signaling modulator 2 [Araneus ventricosus]|uniref:G-protein-signaling modulator 2 n=1 Tax=Araneus ventricosus TaxID=182803 RepID=A0A4Y2D5P7_ARAVE|nr:G-protein-signaling modulator 2 [Araneus ventricosus]